MSRIGKTPIKIPEETEVSVSDGIVAVSGKGGELKKKVHSSITVSVNDGQVVVAPADDSRLAFSLWGTFASHIRNMVIGVNEPFVKKLVLEGVGYKVDVSGDKLVLNVGFSHPVEIIIPTGITVSVVKNEITISGIDKEAVGQFAAHVRSKKKPEPYKGKGIRYDAEIVRRKQGKRSVT
ncbi:50S ribosomal protein L6 [Candidatus Kaiserbacteria bacterium CG10_big_fil_rev_8_21_14_0_10_43_70]|uniref:Large ribosomal subunit protein uL6 n=1 Tax=Candidatus Kaiserbacteria bacterium CG10_big_fil_rev_8_21_14_0_10_43_70 TaxID=1974605 RepID=A0A2H0UJG5_9BACT|nr:MAG: 50S ribosomal protein L6 [Candidatus Kaiserbacteria bacterium CG10_big_fil_rev_8_21_14_0_10_43_70]